MCVHVGDRGQPDILPFHHGSPEAQWKTPLTAGPSSITPPTLPYSGSQSPALGRLTLPAVSVGSQPALVEWGS